MRRTPTPNIILNRGASSNIRRRHTSYFTVIFITLLCFQYGSSTEKDSRRYGSTAIFHHAQLEFQNRKLQDSDKRLKRSGQKQILHSERRRRRGKVHDPSVAGRSSILHEGTINKSGPGQIPSETVRYSNNHYRRTSVLHVYKRN